MFIFYRILDSRVEHRKLNIDCYYPETKCLNSLKILNSLRWKKKTLIIIIILFWNKDFILHVIEYVLSIVLKTRILTRNSINF